jgi:hypothetical protein
MCATVEGIAIRQPPESFHPLPAATSYFAPLGLADLCTPRRVDTSTGPTPIKSFLGFVGRLGRPDRHTLLIVLLGK